MNFLLMVFLLVKVSAKVGSLFQSPTGLLSKERPCKVTRRFVKCLLMLCAVYRRISNVASLYLDQLNELSQVKRFVYAIKSKLLIQMILLRKPSSGS